MLIAGYILPRASKRLTWPPLPGKLLPAFPVASHVVQSEIMTGKPVRLVFDVVRALLGTESSPESVVPKSSRFDRVGETLDPDRETNLVRSHICL